MNGEKACEKALDCPTHVGWVIQRETSSDWRLKPASPIRPLAVLISKFFTGMPDLSIGPVSVIIKGICLAGEILYAKLDPSGKKARMQIGQVESSYGLL